MDIKWNYDNKAWVVIKGFICAESCCIAPKIMSQVPKNVAFFGSCHIGRPGRDMTEILHQMPFLTQRYLGLHSHTMEA